MASSSCQWSFHNGSEWQNYDTFSNVTIERAYQSKESKVSINAHRTFYSIDLNTLVQTNNYTHMERSIKREDKTLPLRMSSIPCGARSRVPSKSGTVSISSGAMPLKSGSLYNKGLSTLSATPDILYTRPHSGPKPSDTRPLSTPSVISSDSPLPMPRKKYKQEPKFPQTLGAYEPFLHKYTEIINEEKIPKDETCPICLTSLLEPADVEVPKKSRSSSLPLNAVSGLKKCSHMFHMACLGTMLDSTSTVKILELSISCPICQTIHGVRTGDQPQTGTMTVAYETGCVPGYEGYGTIRIGYNFKNGVSETGTNFNAAGFPRVCYVPRCPEGEKVLQLLKLAWERRLVFTVGTSVTTGCENCVVWNNIHHKTEPHSNTSGHGFPDPNFLKNIKMELAVQGVTEEELK